MVRRLWVAALFGAIAVAGCANLKGYDAPGAASTGGVTPTPSSSAPSSPVPCNTSTPSAPNVVYVGMSFAIAPTSDPTYGPLAGFGDASSGNVPQFAGRVEVAVGDVVQFVNVEAIGTSEIYHSAVGFGNVTAFPAEPYAFGASTATGSTIGSAPWSTGLIESYDPADDECLSQPFTVPSLGTFFFGDYNYYNGSSSLRGVIVATQTATMARRRGGRLPSR